MPVLIFIQLRMSKYFMYQIAYLSVLCIEATSYWSIRLVDHLNIQYWLNYVIGNCRLSTIGKLVSLHLKYLIVLMGGSSVLNFGLFCWFSGTDWLSWTFGGLGTDVDQFFNVFNVFNGEAASQRKEIPKFCAFGGLATFIFSGRRPVTNKYPEVICRFRID